MTVVLLFICFEFDIKSAIAQGLSTLTLHLADKTVSPPVLLAPMAGITDRPFRDLVMRFGAGMVVSEMVASQEMVQAKPGVRERAELSADVENTAVQLAGREAYWMAEAARQAADRGARVIDINMGCPRQESDQRLFRLGLAEDTGSRPEVDRGCGGGRRSARDAENAAGMG